MFVTWIYGTRERRESMMCYLIFSQKKYLGVSTTYARCTVSARGTTINVTGSPLVWGSRGNSLQKGQLRSPDKRRGRIGGRTWSQT